MKRTSSKNPGKRSDGRKNGKSKARRQGASPGNVASGAFGNPLGSRGLEVAPGAREGRPTAAYRGREDRERHGFVAVIEKKED